MSRKLHQSDLFGVAQPDLFGAPELQRKSYRADPDRVRARLYRILALSIIPKSGNSFSDKMTQREARAADTLPWDASRLRIYRTIVPQMTLWLPDEEAAQLRFAFEAEVARLEAARD